MAVGYPEKMRDATGAVNTYRETPGTNRPEPPKHPHPDAFLTVNGSYGAGRGLHPCNHRPIAERIAQYTEALGHAPGDDDEGMAVSGDATTRLARQQCWDDQIHRAPKKSYTGTEPCEEPTCPHPQPHAAGQWIHHSPWEEGRDPRWGTAYFRDIAHVLYPGGVLPVPVRDEPVDGCTCGHRLDHHIAKACTALVDATHVCQCGHSAPAIPEPEQLDLLKHLEEMTS